MSNLSHGMHDESATTSQPVTNHENGQRASLNQNRVSTDYKIACICPMGVELAPVEGMLDEIHEPLPVSRVRNAYTLGSLGGHNLVIAVMPEIGNNVASAIVTQLLNDFPAIRFGLLVGIGGGVPGNVDLRLGDVVVSQPSGTFPGVVQYDMGKELGGGRFQRTGSLNKPPAVLSASVRKLDSQYRRLGPNLTGLISQMFQKYPKMRTVYSSPTTQDQLFPTDYIHRLPQSSDCDQCDSHYVVPRPERLYNEPTIHYGTIASANKVVRDASLRDKIRDDTNALCIEMEAAGLTDDFPCLVIRGICDYADSHKNKEWQPYAAAVAAAYMKALLLVAPLHVVSATNTVIGRNASVTATDTEEGTHRLHAEILESLAFPEMFNRRNTIRQPFPATCEWIFQHDQYRVWEEQGRGLLWVKGKPGSGKSTLMTVLYDHLQENRQTKSIIGLDFYFSARGVELQHSPQGMFRSLLHQLFKQAAIVQSWIREQYKARYATFTTGSKHRQWQQAELERLFMRAVTLCAEHYQVEIFIDALDEAGEVAAAEIAYYFHDMNQQLSTTDALVKICLSSRHYPIPPRLHGFEVILEEHNGNDIKRLVQDRFRIYYSMSRGDELETRQWRQLAQDLLDRAHGVFQWVQCALELIRKFIDHGDSPEHLQQQLKQVPQGLAEVYEYIIRNVIDKKHRKSSLLLFQWVCFAQRALSATELRCAIAADDTILTPRPIKACETAEFVTSDERMIRRVAALSGGLVEVIQLEEERKSYRRREGPSSLVQVVHQSVNEFLLVHGLDLLHSLQSVPLDLDCQPHARQAELISHSHSVLYWCCVKHIITETDTGQERTRNPNFLNYARWHILSHAQKSQHRRTTDPEAEICLWTRILPFFRTIKSTAPRGLLWPDGKTTLLHIAVYAKLSDMVETLINSNVDVEEQDEAGWTALHMAALEGQLSTAQMLVASGSRVSTLSERGEAPLFRAVEKGHVPVVLWLLGQGVDVNQKNKKGERVLRRAVLRNKEAVVQILLEAKAEDDGDGEECETALQAAASCGNKRILRMLLDTGADVNAVGAENGTALQIASTHGHNEVVQILLDAGAEVNKPGRLHNTALWSASYMGRGEVVRALLDAGADVNATEGGYGTVLAVEPTFGKREIIRMLLDAGADVNACGEKGIPILQRVGLTGNIEILCMLLDAGVDVNARGGKYGTGLQKAAYHGDTRTVRILLDAGADANIVGGEYGTALQAASAFRHEELVQMLLDAGADVNILGGQYGAALIAASYRGCEQVVQMLLDAGADANAMGSEYGTALQAASAVDRPEVVQMLLRAGADPSVLQANDNLPTAIAKEMEHGQRPRFAGRKW